MFIWLITLNIFGFTNGHERWVTIPPYECGSHGRFEYCIDGIPGCVVGCHCHPGYYFDTSTKICEPNVKLTDDYRRHYFQEPTRVQVPVFTSAVSVQSTTVSSHAIDDKIDEITNDADDLGDWLYNQFFKTIENQVINNTENDNVALTRRSGSNPTNKRTSRRSHKYWKAKRKKKKKKKGLKNKLLRITEDDSLFDSSSESSSDDSSGSSSSSDSDDDQHGNTKIKDHGHKKILVVNKRPKPPLPSFIFLPNMETPFFPPIGLPPPPLPMYPMVPVPPMMPPPPFPYPYPVMPHIHEENETTTSTQKTTVTETQKPSNGDPSTVKPKKEPATVPATSPGPPPTEPGVDPAPPDTSPDSPKPETEPPASEIPPEPDTPPGLRSHPKFRHRNIPRHKLMKQLQEKMKRKNKLQNFFANEYQGLEPPFLDLDMPPEFIPNSPITPIIKDDVKDELPPGLQDIDFKYLAQLIHRENLNKTKHNTMHIPPQSFTMKKMDANAYPGAPTRRHYSDTYYINDPVNYENVEHDENNHQITPNTPNNPIKSLPNIPVNPNIVFTRPKNIMPTDTVYNNQYSQLVRNGPANDFQHRHRIDTDDAYYTKLGRQIASMIRNIEGDGEVDVQIEKTNQKLPENPIFNGNNHGSRSYWDRSIRSPYRYTMSFKTNIGRLKTSNENLFSLENEVALAASTVKTLTLRELENIISKIDKTKSKIIKSSRILHPTKISKTSFNVNLLPRSYHPHNGETNQHVNIAPKYHSHHYFNAPERRSNSELTSTSTQVYRSNILLSDFQKLMPDVIDNNISHKTVDLHVDKSIPRSLTQEHLPLSQAVVPIMPRPQVMTYSNLNAKVHQTTENKNFNLDDFDPVIFNQNNKKYVLKNEKKILQYHRPLISKQYESFSRQNSPSYFHSRNFGFFDNK